MRHSSPNRIRTLGLALALALLLPSVAGAQTAVWNFTRIEPASGAWGTTVTLYGYGFTKDTKVFYDGQLIKPVNIAARYITVKIPDQSRDGWFEVEMAGQTLRAPVEFKVKNTPAVTALEPTSGPADEWVTIRGKHFDERIKFFIGGAPVRRQVLGPTECKILIHRGLKSGALSFSYEANKRESTRFKFTLAAYPNLASFEPAKGYFGDKVTLKGSFICPKVKVFLGTVALRVIKQTADREVVVEIPKAAATGRFEIECFTKRFTHGTDFQVEPPFAVVSGVTPSGGKAGVEVTVSGQNFTEKDRFWYGNRLLTKRFVSASEVKVQIPAGVTTAPLSFETFGRRHQATVTYTIYQPPVITGFTPESAWFGSYVSVKGRNFCPTITVFLGAQELPIVKREGETEITVQIPKDAQAGAFKVTCLQWTVASAGRLKLEAPKAGVTKVEPLEAPPGFRLTIEGFNLKPADQFFLGTVRLPMAFESAEKVTVTLPQAAKTGTLIYVSLGRRVDTRIKIDVGWPRPEITGFKPTTAWYNDVVTLEGRKFCDGPIVRLMNLVLPVVSASPEAIRVTLPNGSRSGPFQVTCHGHLVKSAGSLTVEPPYSQITSIYPQAGPWGTWITLTGKNFSKEDKYWIGNTAVTEVRSMSAIEVRIKVPNAAKGGPIAVFSRGRRVVTPHTFRLAFSVPEITALSPGEGYWGDTIVITGQNFCEQAEVRFGQKVATKVVRESDTRIKVEVPRGTMADKVEVRCYGKPGRSADPFKIIKPQPRLVDVSPESGPPKAWLTITGRNLERVSKVWLKHAKHGRVALVTKLVSPTLLKAYVPEGCKGGAFEYEAYGETVTTSFSYIVPRNFWK